MRNLHKQINLAYLRKMSSYIPIDRQISDRTGKLKCFFLRRMVCRNYSVYAYLHCSNRAYHLRPSFHDAHSLQKTAISILTHRTNVSNYKITIFHHLLLDNPHPFHGLGVVLIPHHHDIFFLKIRQVNGRIRTRA